MPRPGPLNEWPLSQALTKGFDATGDPSLKRGSKRPLSPGGPSTYSPAKKRILSEEGIHFLRKKSLKVVPIPSPPQQISSSRPMFYFQDPITSSSTATSQEQGESRDQEMTDYFSSSIASPATFDSDPHFPGFETFFDPDGTTPRISWTQSPPSSPNGKSAHKENQRPKQSISYKRDKGTKIPEIRVHEALNSPRFGILSMEEVMQIPVARTESELKQEEWDRLQAEEDAAPHRCY